MKGTVLYGSRDVRFEDRDEPRIEKPTDAIIRISATCVCGSDLWPYRGIQKIDQPTPMGHEYCGIVEEVGSAVKTVKPGQFVIGSFCISDNTCPNCKAGYQSGCQNLEFMSRAQAPILRVPLADGILLATPEVPSDDIIPSLLTTSDVFGTGWFAADAANVKPGSAVVVVGWCCRTDGRPLRKTHGCRTNHRDESARKAPGAREGIWSNRHRDGTRR